MKIYKIAQCNYQPLNAPKRIDAPSLIDGVLSLHFDPRDSLEIEESDVPNRLNSYDFYDLKLISINDLPEIDSIKNAPVSIFDHRVQNNKDKIKANNSYPPIVVDVMKQIIDGYHRVFALKELGCNKVWAYVPDLNSKNENYELV